MASEMKYLMEKATSPLLLEMDWDTTMQIVDKIRQGDIPPKTAVASVLNYIEDKNHNIVLATLSIAEALMKNCGSKMHEVMATKDSMAVFYNLMHRTENDEVKSRTIMLLSAWTFAFRNKPSYGAIQDCLSLLKMEGCDVPSVTESDAMFMAEMAPDWVDGEKCYRCRTQFTLLRRKHHCRACGQVFCSDCSNKTSTIPKFGIEKEVRVCTDCYTEVNSPTSKPRTINTVPNTENVRSASAEKEEKEKQKAQELREEEDLQLALALSKSEHETKEKEKMRSTSNYSAPRAQRSSSPTNLPVKKYEDEQDPELAKYLNRSYWEEQKEKRSDPTTEKNNFFSSNSPSAPHGTNKNRYTSSKTNESYVTNDADELDDFVATLRSQLEIFVNRMKSNQSRGRPIANDSAVQSLFMNITTMHAQLLKHMQEIETKRVYYEQLQDKISQTRDARAALEALREEHREKLRQEREEQDRIRQMQMMQKLEIMRKKKQEYLEYQRQMALHRMAESERQILNQPGTMPPGQIPPGHGYPMHYPGAYPPQQPMGYMPPEAMQMPPGGMPSYQAPPQGMGQNGYPNASVPQGNMQPSQQPAAPQASIPPSQMPGTIPPGAQAEYGYPIPGSNQGMPPTTYTNPMSPPITQMEAPSGPPPQMAPQGVPQPPKQEEAALISFD